MLTRPESDDPTLRMMEESLAAFISRRVLPEYAAWEAARMVPPAIWREMGASGFLCADVPEEMGGPGAEFGHSALVLSVLSRAGATGLAAGASVHSDIVAPYLVNHATPEQQARWLPGMAAGEIVGAIAMTEPGTGSDLAAIRTRARKSGTGWVLDG
ncbi:MAG: acyl-CoA dehydrogenase family protein, partial [Rhodobacteraceae bacterium]|nr:acyl-CoA dehydrogenase family protein [Paracoccaceae bacterium]